MMKGVSVHTLVALLVFAALVVGCAPAATSPPPTPTAKSTAASIPTNAPAATPAPKPKARETIHFGQVAVDIAFWPVYVAEAKGFFEEQALTLERILTRTGDASVAGVVSGDLDLASGAEDSIRATAKGLPVVLAVGMQDRASYTFVSLPQIKSPQDIKGKTVGVSKPQGFEWDWLMAFNQKHSLTVGKDYDVLAIGANPDRFAALDKGAVAMAILSPPLDFRLLQKGYNKLALTHELIPPDLFGAYFINKEKAPQRQEAIVRFIRAIRKAGTWLYDPQNKQEAIDIAAKAFNLPPAEVDYVYDFYVKEVRSYSPDGSIWMEGLQLKLSRLEQQGAIKRMDPKDYIDLSYYDAAIKGQ